MATRPGRLGPQTRTTLDPLNCAIHLPRIDLTLAYRALPCAVLPFTVQKPTMPNCLRATFTASMYLLNPLDAYLFLARAEAALLTTLPSLFFVNCSLVRPPTVFSFRPLSTLERALLPRAILLTFMAFMAFMAFPM